jgi:Uma2 family endonuclease
LDEEQTEKALAEKTKFINFAPFFCVEVVSAPKNGLKQSLEKMKNIWMENGTEIGLVLDPFGKNYYLFEAKKASFEKISFQKAFKHSKLKGLVMNFDALWQRGLQPACSR